MNRETKTLLFANVELFDQLEAQLRAGKQVDGYARDGVIYDETVMFDDGCMMDIKVVNAETDGGGPWTEGVLFHAPSEGFPAVGEIGCTDVGDSLAATYIVAANDKEYCVVVERATKN